MRRDAEQIGQLNMICPELGRGKKEKTSPDPAAHRGSHSGGEKFIVKQSGAVDDAKNHNRLPADAEDGAVRTVEKMSVIGAENIVFGNTRTALGELLQRGDLRCERVDKGGGPCRTFLGDVIPDRGDIGFGTWGDLNPEYRGHA